MNPNDIAKSLNEIILAHAKQSLTMMMRTWQPNNEIEPEGAGIVLSTIHAHADHSKCGEEGPVKDVCDEVIAELKELGDNQGVANAESFMSAIRTKMEEGEKRMEMMRKAVEKTIVAVMKAEDESSDDTPPNLLH